MVQTWSWWHWVHAPERRWKWRDRLSHEGQKVGVLKVTCFRPFPYEELRRVLGGVKCVAVIDRSWALGSEGRWRRDQVCAVSARGAAPRIRLRGRHRRSRSPRGTIRIVEKASSFKKRRRADSPEWAVSSEDARPATAAELSRESSECNRPIDTPSVYF